ncbi:hypothetical protein CCP2SC5_1090005 [Azospirillaceae bacterium]
MDRVLFDGMEATVSSAMLPPYNGRNIAFYCAGSRWRDKFSGFAEILDC